MLGADCRVISSRTNGSWIPGGRQGRDEELISRFGYELPFAEQGRPSALESWPNSGNRAEWIALMKQGMMPASRLNQYGSFVWSFQAE
jgi:hypothetical protein